MSILKLPSGYEEIVATYGDPGPFFKPDGSFDRLWWERHLKLVLLPFPRPLELSFAPGKFATHYRVHPKAADMFRAAFQDLDWNGGLEHIKTYGGTFEFRTKRRTARQLSTHAWGIAIDLNPEYDEIGRAQHPRLVGAFKAAGFEWAGDWSRGREVMHWQACTGY